MSEDSESGFQSVMGTLMSGSLGIGDSPADDDADESEEEDTSTAPDASAPDEESPEGSDKPAGDPSDEEESEAASTEDVDEPSEPEETDAPAGEVDSDDADDVEAEADVDAEGQDDGADISDDTEADEGDEPTVPETVEIDGEEVPFEEVRDGYMRQQDYTRKTQELAREREEVQQTIEEQQTLVRDINSHEGMRQFVSEHPEAMQYLLARPEETRELMQSPSKLEAFKEDYEILQESPELAEAYARAGDGERAQEQLEMERTVRNATQFANTLDARIDELAESEEYADVLEEDDVDAVKRRVLEIGGFDEESPPEEVLRGVNKLAGIFVAPDGESLDMSLVKDRFDAIKARREAERQSEEEKAADHNEQVDAELEEQEERPPASPEGDGPAPEPETIPERESFHDVLDGITSM